MLLLTSLVRGINNFALFKRNLEPENWKNICNGINVINYLFETFKYHFTKHFSMKACIKKNNNKSCVDKNQPVTEKVYIFKKNVNLELIYSGAIKT